MSEWLSQSVYVAKQIYNIGHLLNIFEENANDEKFVIKLVVTTCYPYILDLLTTIINHRKYYLLP